MYVRYHHAADAPRRKPAASRELDPSLVIETFVAKSVYASAYGGSAGMA